MSCNSGPCFGHASNSFKAQDRRSTLREHCALHFRLSWIQPLLEAVALPPSQGWFSHRRRPDSRDRKTGIPEDVGSFTQVHGLLKSLCRPVDTGPAKPYDFANFHGFLYP